MKKATADVSVFFITILAILFQFFIFYPIYIAAADGIYLRPVFILTILGYISCGSLVFALLFAAVAHFFKWEWLLTPLVALLLLLFIKGMVFPSPSAGVLDGRNLITINASVKLCSLLITGYLILLALCWKLRARLRYMGIPVLIVLITCTGYLLYKNRDKVHVPYIPPPFEMPPFSTERNVVAIGRDAVQGTVVESLFGKEPDLYSEFEGFSIYTRGFTSYPFTFGSKPLLASGLNGSENKGDWKDYYKYGMENSFVLSLLNKGFNVVDIDFTNIQDIRPASAELSRAGSRYRSYAAGKLDGHGINMVDYKYPPALAATAARLIGFWPDIPWLKEVRDLHWGLKLEGLKIYSALPPLIKASKDTKPLLLAAWDMSPHTPVVFSRDGTIEHEMPFGAYYVMEEEAYHISNLNLLLRSLKNAGVYDNSLILFFSDHGHSDAISKKHFEGIPGFEHAYVRASNFRPSSFYNIVLFIKPPFASGKPVLVHEPFWAGDIKAIIDYYSQVQDYEPARQVVHEMRRRNPEPDVLYYAGETNFPSPLNFKEFNYIKTDSVEALKDKFTQKFEETSIWAQYTLGQKIPPFTKGCYRGWFTDQRDYADQEDDVGVIQLQINEASSKSGYDLTMEIGHYAAVNGDKEQAVPQTVSLVTNGYPILVNQTLQYGQNTIHVSLPPGIITDDGKIKLEFGAGDSFVPAELSKKRTFHPYPSNFLLTSLVITEGASQARR